MVITIRFTDICPIYYDLSLNYYELGACSAQEFVFQPPHPLASRAADSQSRIQLVGDICSSNAMLQAGCESSALRFSHCVQIGRGEATTLHIRTTMFVLPFGLAPPQSMLPDTVFIFHAVCVGVRSPMKACVAWIYVGMSAGQAALDS